MTYCHSDSGGKPSASAGVKNPQMLKIIIIIMCHACNEKVANDI